MLYRKFDLLITDVIVVGCGGTGSRLVPPLVQMLKNAQNAINPALYLIDFDEVEFSNLSRQNFIEPDLGQNKAQVLAERYSAALEFPVFGINGRVAVNTPIVQMGNHLERRINPSTRKLVIMCVDSVQARLEIMAASPANTVFIDAGNEDSYGNVSIFDNVHTDLFDLNLTDLKPFSNEVAIPFIPAPTARYMDNLRNPPVATGSCADQDQSLAVNFQMSAGILAAVQSLTFNTPFVYNTNYYDLIRGNTTSKMTNVWWNQTMAVHDTGEDIVPDPVRSRLNNATSAFLSSVPGNNSSRIVSNLHTVHNKIIQGAKLIDPALLALVA